MDFFEQVDIERVAWLLENFNYDMFSTIDVKEQERFNFSSIKKILQHYIKCKNNNHTVYKKSPKDKFQILRDFASPSIQGLPTIIRGFICEKNMTDIDMVNCHPTILLHLCNKYGISCEYLQTYCLNRKQLIADGKANKTKVIECINKIYPLQNDYPFMMALDTEIKQIQQQLIHIDEFNDCMASAKEQCKLKKDQKNLIGTFMSNILTKYEVQILHKVIQFIKGKGLTIAVLMFDGIMVYGNHYDNNELLLELSQYVFNEFGIDMKWSYKAHDCGNLSLPEDWERPKELEDIKKEEDENYNDVEETSYVLSKYPHWKYCNGELYCFDIETGLWTTSKPVHIRIIQEHARGRYKKFLTAIKNILGLIPSKCIDDNFIEKNANSSIGYLLFDNGYYEAKTGKFYTKFNPDIVFFGKIYNDFIRATEEDMEDVKRRLFYVPLNQTVGDYYLQILSRGLMGDKMKKVVFGLGQTNCGKSTLTQAISKSFGEYIGIFNAGNFIKKEITDDAQSLRWALILRYKRLIFSNEMDATKTLNGNELKKISGHDDLVGRDHCQSEKKFTLHFLPICFANDMPCIKPFDDALNNRAEVINYEKKFVDEPSNEYELKKDIELGTEMETKKFQQIMISLFITEYEKYLKYGAMSRPKECENAKVDWIDQDVGSLPAFLNEYEITNDKKDKVPASEIKQWLEDQKMGITCKKFCMELRLHCKKNNFENVESKFVSIDGKKFQAYIGVKRL